jgi:alkylation response protein AidB-like acyl-CoA dehydrogenase
MDLSLTGRQQGVQRDLDALLGAPDARAIGEMVADEPGFDASQWAAVAQVIAPACTFAAGTLTDLVVVAEALGYAAFPSPFHNRVVQSGWVLALGGHADRIAAPGNRGRAYALCLTEPSGLSDLDAITTTATPVGGAWSVDGEKCFVPYAASADALLVVARAADRDDVVVVEVDPRAAGVAMEAIPTLGRDRQVAITFRAAPATLVVTDAAVAVEQAMARALVVLCADAVGAARAALDYTVARITTREQWDAPIGSFQAVQHRAADMLIDVTTARDAVFDAAGRIDRGEDALAPASATKGFVVDAARRVTAGAHQLNGGEGIHADVPLHLWYRRVKAAEPVLGSPAYHRARVAAHLLDP